MLIETENYLQVPHFATELKITRQAVDDALNRGAVPFVTIDGKRFVDKVHLSKWGDLTPRNKK